MRGNYLRTTAGASQEANAKTPYTIPLLEHYEYQYLRYQYKPKMLMMKMVKMTG